LNAQSRVWPPASRSNSSSASPACRIVIDPVISAGLEWRNAMRRRVRVEQDSGSASLPIDCERGMIRPEREPRRAA
jgi:hypothetical protein